MAELGNDPDASIFLSRVLNRYASVASLSVIIRKTSVFADRNPLFPVEATVLLKYQRPNLVDVEVADTRGRSHVWVDGQFQYEEYVTHPNTYSMRAAPPDERAIDTVLVATGNSYARLFLGRFEPFDEITVSDGDLGDSDVCKLTTRIRTRQIMNRFDIRIRSSDLLLLDWIETVESDGVQTARGHWTYEYLTISDTPTFDPAAFRHVLDLNAQKATKPIYFYNIDFESMNVKRNRNPTNAS